MQNIKCDLKSPIVSSFKISAIRGMYGFDDKETRHIVEANLPDFSDDWKIGVITGPSGSGKSVLSKKWAGEYYQKSFKWGSLPIVEEIKADVKSICEMFVCVGFSSVPNWLKPYSLLSEGEKMRANLARCLIEKNIICFDEFSSTVDRHVARIISKSLGRYIRKTDKKFVAISCHEDFINDIQPDWILRVPEKEIKKGAAGKSGTFRFAIGRVENNQWENFRQYHYLDHNLHKAAKCWGCFDMETKNIIGFCAILQCCGWTGRDRISRIIILPDYQGIGIGTKFLNSVAKDHFKTGRQLSITTAHPGFIKSLFKNTAWKFKGRAKLGTSPSGKDNPRRKTSGTSGISGTSGCFLSRTSISFERIAA